MELETVIFLHLCKQENQSNSELLDDGVGLSWWLWWMMVFFGLQRAAGSGRRAGVTCPHSLSLVLIHSQGQLWRPCGNMVCTNLCLFAQGRGVPGYRGCCRLSEPFTPCPKPKGPVEHLMKQRYFLWERTERSQISSQQASALLAFPVAAGGRKVSSPWEPTRGSGSGVMFGKGAAWCLLLGTRRPS